MRGWVHRLLIRAKALLRPGHDKELGDELQVHLEMLEDEYRAAGMNPADARAAARRQFGNATGLKEQSRDLFTFQLVDDIWRDVRFGVRSLRKTPVFTVATVLILALGIGACVAAFSVANAVLFQPLPFDDPEELVTVDVRSTDSSQFFDLSADLFESLEESQALNGLAGWHGVIATREDGVPEKLMIDQVRGRYFETLRVEPALGTVFASAEVLPNGTYPAVISHRYWQRAWGGSPAAIGRTFRVQGLPLMSKLTIVAVMPASFGGPAPFGSVDADVWTPSRISARVHAFARVQDGQTLSSAQAEMDVVTARLKEQLSEDYAHLQSPAGVRLQITDGQARAVGNFAGRVVVIFSAAVLLVFLIALLNLIHLQAARCSSKERELSVRAAIGASRGRLVRQMLVEVALLAVVGGVLGFTLAYVIRDAAIASFPNPGALPRLDTVAIDLPAFGFALLSALFAAFVVGLIPALRVSRSSLNDALKEGQTTVVASRWRWLHYFVTASESAFATVLLVVAGLLLDDVRHLVSFDAGFETDNVAAARFTLPVNQANPASQGLFYSETLRKLRGLPGVEAASVSSEYPRLASTHEIRAEGSPATSQAVVTDASADYLSVFRLRLLSGRWIADEDIDRRATVAIVSSQVADELWPGQNPLGRQIRIAFPNAKPLTVIGVTQDVRFSAGQKRLAWASGSIYTPFLGEKSMPLDRTMTVAVRYAGPSPLSLEEFLSKAEPGAAASIISNDEALAPWIPVQRFFAKVLSLFSATALILAMLGVYGVVAYTIAQRTREIALRMALGASERKVVLHMMRPGCVPAAIGLVAGLILSLGASQLLESFLYELKPAESLAYGMVVLIGIAIVFLASWIPARRAASVDPMIALRHE